MDLQIKHPISLSSLWASVHKDEELTVVRLSLSTEEIECLLLTGEMQGM